MCLAAFMAVAHQPGLLQNGQMLGDRGLGNTRLGGQGSDRLLALAAQPLEDRPAFAARIMEYELTRPSDPRRI